MKSFYVRPHVLIDLDKRKKSVPQTTFKRAWFEGALLYRPSVTESKYAYLRHLSFAEFRNNLF